MDDNRITEVSYTLRYQHDFPDGTNAETVAVLMGMLPPPRRRRHSPETLPSTHFPDTL